VEVCQKKPQSLAQIKYEVNGRVNSGERRREGWAYHWRTRVGPKLPAADQNAGREDILIRFAWAVIHYGRGEWRKETNSVYQGDVKEKGGNLVYTTGEKERMQRRLSKSTTKKRRKRKLGRTEGGESFREKVASDYSYPGHEDCEKKTQNNRWRKRVQANRRARNILKGKVGGE